jgi:threonine aldolase
MKAFASDNYASVHPEIMKALHACNEGHAPAYGSDDLTAQAEKIFKRHFGKDAETFFVFNGTGANIVGLDTVMQPFQSIICAQNAHINVDECGGVEKITGKRMIPVMTPDGKLTPELVKPHLRRFGDEHHAQPRVIAISQTTELGTVYTVAEIRALSEFAHKHDMVVHMDGSRISNAAAALNSDFRSFTTDAGVDVLSFGGGKNGMMYGEAVVFLRKGLGEFAKYYRKQNGQLASKHRYIAAQFIALLDGDLWLRNAKHANDMAKRLAQAIAGLKHIHLTQKVESNVVFARLPEAITHKLMQDFRFYIWNELTHEVRWMTSFDTTQKEVDAFAKRIVELGA